MTDVGMAARRIGSDELRFDEACTEHVRPDTELARALAPGGRLVETLRVLGAKVESLDAERRLRCVGVVAVTPDEGCSLTALGLATALARGGSRPVLLVEAGLRAPSLESRLRLEAAPGLSDWLAGSGVGSVPLRRIEPWGFSLLAAGTPQAEPARLLESGALSRLFEAAARSFEFVVVDSPPLLTAADSVLLQDRLDGYLLVVRARRVPRERILQAVSQLKPERLRGVVFNDLREIFSRTRPLRHG